MLLINEKVFWTKRSKVLLPAQIGDYPKAYCISFTMAEWSSRTFNGTVRRELLDHVIPLSEDHLDRLLKKYIHYYNTSRSRLRISPLQTLFTGFNSYTRRVTQCFPLVFLLQITLRTYFGEWYLLACFYFFSHYL